MFRFGSGHAGRLLEFLAEKPALKFRFPEAAIRHGVQPTRRRPSNFPKADRSSGPAFSCFTATKLRSSRS